ncbi:MAG: hypothetical protein KIT36_12135 [Alphaproteobacteria bacterium]|nr:hypothetical protein [Alphaproteobacteria bacterium]
MAAAYGALATLYNALMTGIVLSLVARRGADTARQFVMRHFRRQHLEKFLPGLKKLGLDGLPHAVACALYHYHSNALGGVKTEYLRESDRKAWVRYPPPRWIWRGTAVCAVPHAVNEAMLHGWHGHNGVSLGNPRLGFVCTGMITSGTPGLEGYYFEHDRALEPQERVRFVDGERMPRIDPVRQPALDTANWPDDRRHRTFRAYAMEYVRSLVPTLIEMLGVGDAEIEIGHAARLIGMQFYDETAQALGHTPGSGGGAAFARYLEALLAAQGEDVACDVGAGSAVVRQRGWRLMKDVSLVGEGHAAAALRAWNELWVGAALAHDRFMTVDLAGDPAGEITWMIR